MPHSKKAADVPWDSVLRDALNEDDVRLFLERRADVTVEIRPDDTTRTTRTAWAGASADRIVSPSRQVYCSSPAGEDLARVAALEAEASNSLSRLVDAVRRLKPDARVSGRCVLADQQVWVTDRAIGEVQDRRRGARYRVEARLVRATAASRAVAEAVGTPTAAGLREPVIDRLARHLADRVERRLDAVAPAAGQLQVVLAPGVGGVLIHEIVGHALEADTYLSGNSWLNGAKSPVAPRELVIVDDPRRGRAAWRHDDEGSTAAATRLVGDGRVTGCLHSTATAQAAGARATGHGRRSSYREPVRPRMGCTFVSAGAWEAEEIIRSVGQGVYVRRMEAASVDLHTGRAVFRVTDADRIAGGRLDAPLTSHILLVDGRNALARMDRVADDLAFDTCVGSCHRDGQPLAISVGAPTIWIGLSTVVCPKDPPREKG